MTFHIPFEDAIVAGFLIWLGVSLLYRLGGWLKELLWTGFIMAYHHIYFRVYVWRMRPKRARRSR